MKSSKISNRVKGLIASVLALGSLSKMAFAGVIVPPESSGPNYQMLILLVVFIGIFYFFMIRPQMKRQKEHRNLLSSLSKGDEVVTTGGVYGVIESVNDAKVELRVAEGVVMKFQKQAIGNVLPKGSI